MSTITLNAEMTKNEFRKSFTDNFDHIYLRVKADKAGKTKLSDSKYFTVGAEISIDENVTVAEFEKEATAKTGMDVSIYYETKPEAGKSKYYLVRKNDSDTTLSDLESRVAEMDDIVSQKEYMDKLVNGKKSANTSEVKDEKLESNQNIGSIIKWIPHYIEEEESFVQVFKGHIPDIINLIETTCELISIDMYIPSTESYIPYNADVDIELFKNKDGEIEFDYNGDDEPLLVFHLADKDIDQDELMNALRDSIIDSPIYGNREIDSKFRVEFLNAENERDIYYGYDYEDYEFFISE